MTEIRQRLYEPAVYITDTLPGEAARDAARMARHRADLDCADDMMAAQPAFWEQARVERAEDKWRQAVKDLAKPFNGWPTPEYVERLRQDAAALRNEVWGTQYREAAE